MIIILSYFCCCFAIVTYSVMLRTITAPQALNKTSNTIWKHFQSPRSMANPLTRIWANLGAIFLNLPLLFPQGMEEDHMDMGRISLTMYSIALSYPIGKPCLSHHKPLTLSHNSRPRCHDMWMANSWKFELTLVSKMSFESKSKKQLTQNG